MRFTGPDDDTLPPRIRALAKERRLAFVNAYNAAGEDPDAAMVVAMKAIEDTLCRCGKELTIAPQAEKAECDSCRRSYKVAWRDVKDDDYAMCCPVLAEVYKPLGGATSFNEADQYFAAAEIDNNVWKLRYDFEDICRNIWDDLEMNMTDKAAAIARAAQDLASRIAAGPPNSKSFADKAKDVLNGIRGKTKQDGGVTYKATDYADVKDASDPETWKVRLTDDTGAVTVSSIAAAIKELQPKGFAETAAILGDTKANVVLRISEAIDRVEAHTWQKGRLHERLETATQEPGAFFVTKDVDGAWRWLAIFSNRWKDRDGEVFCADSHREYERYVDSAKDYPEAWVWHTPGTRFGLADVVTYDESGFMFSSGTFDKGMEKAAQALASMKEPLGVSHGYEYLSDDLTKEGVYERYRTREISVLPLSKAANQWTLFTLIDNVKEADIMFNPDKRQMIVATLGEEKTGEIERRLDATAKELTAAGISYKEFSELLSVKAEGEGDPAPAEAEQAAAAAPAADATAGGPHTHVVPAAPLTLEAIQGAISAAIAPLATSLAEVQGEVKALKEGEDAKIAEALTPGRPPVGERASEAAETELTKEQQEAADKALKETDKWDGSPIAPFMKNLVGDGVGSAARS